MIKVSLLLIRFFVDILRTIACDLHESLNVHLKFQVFCAGSIEIMIYYVMPELSWNLLNDKNKLLRW
jgi:hypothetical protein